LVGSSRTRRFTGWRSSLRSAILFFSPPERYDIFLKISSPLNKNAPSRLRSRGISSVGEIDSISSIIVFSPVRVASKSWEKYPHLTSFPSRKVPEKSRSEPERILRRVDLPAPFLPASAIFSPLVIERFISFRAW